MELETASSWLSLFVLTAFTGGIYLVLPRIGRRGLLFGVYVGEEQSAGDEAHRMIRRWQVRMVLWLAFGLLGGVLTGLFSSPEDAPLASCLILTAGYFIEYLQAHQRARALARGGPPPLAAAPLLPGDLKPLLLPPLALGLALAGAIFALGYAWSHYAELPAVIPIHFGASGAPDAWRPKSVFGVMQVPLLALVLGLGLGGAAILISGAKRAIRYPDGGASLHAQERFRRAMARYIAGTALLVTAMLTSTSVFAIRIGLGRMAGFPAAFVDFIFIMIVWVIGGVLYLLARYGQGGARLEGAAARTPLTDGLADNRRWILGIIYVNRDDPSFLVEHRFGFGYTLNFGNWKAVALFAAFLALMLGIALAAFMGF